MEELGGGSFDDGSVPELTGELENAEQRDAAAQSARNRQVYEDIQQQQDMLISIPHPQPRPLLQLLSVQWPHCVVKRETSQISRYQILYLCGFVKQTPYSILDSTQHKQVTACRLSTS